MGLREKILGKRHHVVEWVGDYPSFAEAAKVCDGYDSDAIFEKVKQGTIAVIAGRACFERDSYLFYEKEINYNLMMYLQKRYIEDGYLNVCDWGGALGSTYLQHRTLLEEMHCKWSVVEQKHFVEWGRENIHVGGLSFHSSIQEREKDTYNCVLLSSVLQYLEHVEQIVRDVKRESPKYIVIERTPVSDCDHIWVEKVHEPIYEASYAAYVFEEKRLIGWFCDDRKYQLIDSWHSLIDRDEWIDKRHKVEFKSFVFERI